MNKLIFKFFYLKSAFPALLLLVAFLMGCATITGQATTQPSEVSKGYEVYFCPRNDCSKALESKIESADFSVHCAFYDMDLRNVISSLAEKSKDIDVRLVMDSSNYEEQVKGDGIKLDDDKQLMHNKFCVIDNSIVVTGSFNPTDNDNSKNKNNMIVVYSSILAKNYEDEFEELWSGRFGEGNKAQFPTFYLNEAKIENYFCPEDGCASRIIELINNAQSSIYFMSFSFTNEGIADALILKNDLDVQGIVDSSQASSKYSQFKRLQDFGINVKKDDEKYKMHNKVFIIDNKTVATGSFNPTLSADTRNDENLIIIHDRNVAEVFLKEFDNLWK